MMQNYLVYIEDDPIELIKFKRAYKELDAKTRIESFENGAKGLDFLIENVASPPKIIILDLRMPVMNGFEFLEKIKNHLSLRKIPVIVFTSSDDKNDVSLSYDNQVAGYFVKPFSHDAYKKVVEKINAYWTTSQFSF